MDDNLQGAIADLDSEFLHDFRVAVRRTRSLLSELKSVFPTAALQRFRAEFGWLGALTSEVRDLDVYLLKFETYRGMVPEPLRDAMHPLHEFLVRRQRLAQRDHLAPALRSARYRKLHRQWLRFLDAPLAARPLARDATRPIVAVARQRIWRTFKRVLREGSAIDRASPHEDLHELRKTCKKLRYLMEFFQSLFPAEEILALVKELKRLQDNLGDFQDLDVQIRSLTGFAGEMRAAGDLAPETERALAALADHLGTEMNVVRSEFEARFERFARQETRAQFKQLFRDSEPEASA